MPGLYISRSQLFRNYLTILVWTGPKKFVCLSQRLADSATHGLTVRPGNCKKPVTFLSYYERNWESCSFRWVWAFRKNLPTEGTNDTQASESTFRAIKYYTKLEFGGKTPTMNQIIICLPKIIDTRTEERMRNIDSRRLVIHHENKVHDKALEEFFSLECRLNNRYLKKICFTQV